MPRYWLSGFHPVQVVREAVPRSLVLIILRSQHFYSLNLKQWRNKLNLLWHELLEFSVSVTLLIDSIHPSVVLLHLLSEFIGKLNDGFPQPIILKYKTHSLKGKFNSNRGNQGLKLTQRWWVDLELTFWVPMQSYLYVWCSILKEGSDLNIEIYKESQQWKIITFRRAPVSDLLCGISIKFDDLWKHLVSESQMETKCELILASISSNVLRMPQPTSQWNLWM